MRGFCCRQALLRISVVAGVIADDVNVFFVHVVLLYFIVQGEGCFGIDGVRLVDNG